MATVKTKIEKLVNDSLNCFLPNVFNTEYIWNNTFYEELVIVFEQFDSPIQL